jgi:hypothetical protein
MIFRVSELRLNMLGERDCSVTMHGMWAATEMGLFQEQVSMFNYIFPKSCIYNLPLKHIYEVWCFFFFNTYTCLYFEMCMHRPYSHLLCMCNSNNL